MNSSFIFVALRSAGSGLGYIKCNIIYFMLYSYKDVKVFVCEYDNEIQNELFIENYMAFKIYLNDLI